MQPRIDAAPVAGLAGGRDGKRVINELYRAASGLLPVLRLKRIRSLKERIQPVGAGNRQIPQMAAEGRHEMKGIEAPGKYVREPQQGCSMVTPEKIVHQRETVLMRKHVEIVQHLLILHLGAAEGNRLVEYGEGVTHGAVSLGRYHVQGLVPDGDALPVRNGPEVRNHIRNAYPVEIIGLAAGKYGREYLVLLGGGKYEYGVCRRLLQSLEESVERLVRKHMHLVHDEHAVTADLRRDVDLLYQRLYILHAVVGSGIKLMYAVGPALLERTAGLAFAARFHILPRMGAVDGLGEYSRSAGLSHSSRAAEKVGVRELPPDDGILQSLDYRVLADERFKGIRPVFAC